MNVAVGALATGEKRQAAVLAAGALGGCTMLALFDPNDGGPYPACPTQALLGIDCPACGTLRGLHALLRGRVGTALDHNVLLVAAVPLAVAALVLTVLPLAGRPRRALVIPRWAVVIAAVVALTFGVVRNLGIGVLSGLDSGA